MAAGRLGISHPPGKKLHLSGDGTVSGTNPACRIHEKVRLPTMESVQRFLSASAENHRWAAFSFDVRGERQLARVREPEPGVSCFVVKGRWFVYRCCYFGCSWSSYWFSRVGSLLVHLTHRLLWVARGLFLYVDDGLALFPLESAPLLASVCVMFLVSLGVPLSWEKLQLGGDLSWIGWDLRLSTRSACLPACLRRSSANC